MGNTAAKRANKQEIADKKVRRNDAVKKRQQDLEETQFEMNRVAIQAIKNGTDEGNNQLTISNLQQTHAILQTATTQLNRGGSPFTKADLIAIICYIQPAYIDNIDELKKNTVEDLNTIIRLVIYDPNHFAPQSTTTTTGTTQYRPRLTFGGLVSSMKSLTIKG
jgi:hypothetical protein